MSTTKKRYIVRWTESHEYKYVAYIDADSLKEALGMANSYEENDGRHCEFNRVLRVSRKTAERLEGRGTGR